jgi:MoxR-like ATPase
MSTQNASPDDVAAVTHCKQSYDRIRSELAKVIVGQDRVIEQVLIAVLARGHALLEGVPGLAKTLLVSSLSEATHLSFKRIQFTPDLMPSDVTGTEIIQEDMATHERQYKFLPGPIFANMILADEINRTPPKTQAAMLEAMQERQVSAGGKMHKLPDPFFVLATQNPIEQEGTYPLPEAQLDRFMFMIMVDYPEEDEEFQIVKMTTAIQNTELAHVLSAQDILTLQDIVRKVPVADHVIRYALRLTRATRKEKGAVPDFIRDFVSWGCGPRAGQYLILAGKARALLQQRYYVSTEDIRAVAHPVLRHRVLTNFNAEAEGIKPDHVIDRLLDAIRPDHSADLDGGKLPKVFADAPAPTAPGK